ncbi:MAG: hypothetical protein LBH18_04275 [Spirochaetaceae bacterium]|nr:hypothetical protein [Spirochaetaceae bacterium]
MKLKGLVFLILVFCAASISAQNFNPFSILRVLRTEHFEFIYSKASALTAQKLASRAEAIYDNISAMTGLSLDRRVPVIVTPETDEHNGYMNPLPYPHIAIFDTPASIEWTVFANSLEALFLHEMTHAITGTTRSPAAKVLNRVFGGWVYPTGLNAPWFMIEGAAVSFESLDGTGRSNDPLIKQKLRQDIIENSFKTPFQSAGVWDMPSLGNVYYYYGGLFSSYLQKKYGMEKYGLLWREMGGDFHGSLFVYNSGFYHIFKSVYGLSIVDCWKDFEKSLALDDIKENASKPVYGGKSAIKDIAAAAGKIFFIDSLAAKVVAYDTETKKLKSLIDINSAAYALDVSADGRCILVSTYRRLGANSGQFSRAVAVEYNAASGFPTGREWQGLYNARYFMDGVVALRSDTHIANLVYRAGNDRAGKNEEVLLRGSETLLFSNPSPVDDEWIAFTSAKRGIRELSLFNYKTRSVYTLKGDSSDSENSEDDVSVWRYMRGLRFSGGRLYFSYNDDDRMYKLASVSVSDLRSGSAVAYFADTDFSGGVFQPVSSGDAVYYRAAFSVWDAVLPYPEIPAGFEGRGAALTMFPWESEWVITKDAYNKIDSASVLPSKLYNPVKYFNPFNLWLPFPLVSPVVNSIFDNSGNTLTENDIYENLRLDGAGLVSFISDPMDQNLIFLGAGYDFHYNIAPINITWRNFSFMLPVIVDFSDVVIADKRRDGPLRKMHASVQASYRISLGDGRLSLMPFGMLSNYWYFYGNDAETDAYNWPLRQETHSVVYGFRLSNLALFPWERFGNGFSNQLYVKNPVFVDDVFPRFENVFNVSAESIRILQDIPIMNNFAFDISLYGAYDKYGMNHLGHSLHYSNSIFDNIGTYEYSVSPSGYIYQWLTGGEVEWSPASFEIQKNLSHLYFNRVFALFGYRWVYMGDETDSYRPSRYDAEKNKFLHSALFRLSLVSSIVPITVLPLKITFNLTAVLKLSALDNGIPGDDWYFGWGFLLSY